MLQEFDERTDKNFQLCRSHVENICIVGFFQNLIGDEKYFSEHDGFLGRVVLYHSGIHHNFFACFEWVHVLFEREYFDFLD